MWKADYQHLLPLKNSSNLFKGPRTPPRSSGSPAPLSASVGPLKSTPEVGPGSDRQKHKAFGDKCVKMSNIDLAPLTYSNLTPQRDLFDGGSKGDLNNPLQQHWIATEEMQHKWRILLLWYGKLWRSPRCYKVWAERIILVQLFTDILVWVLETFWLSQNLGKGKSLRGKKEVKEERGTLWIRNTMFEGSPNLEL